MERYGGEVLSVGWVFIPSNNSVALRQKRAGSHGRPLVSSKSFLFWYPTDGSSDRSSTLLQKVGVVVTIWSEAYNDHNGTLVSLGSGQ